MRINCTHDIREEPGSSVYCRPCCASRLVWPEKVQFHSACAEAEKAGFRSCKPLSSKAAALCGTACGENAVNPEGVIVPARAAFSERLVIADPEARMVVFY